MAYSELIKNFDRIRGYMREFYVYGFRTRSEYDQKSARSYDNVRRRLESWLGEYMSFRADAEGRHTFLSVDSRAVPSNPLFRAYKSKSFTANDITLHFLVLDVLTEGRALSVSAVLEEITDRLSALPESVWIPDESTLRRKLREYVSLGLLERIRAGREVLYRRNRRFIAPAVPEDALQFASGTDPLGVIGSFLLDHRRAERQVKAAPGADAARSFIRFKHRYLLSALDQEVLSRLMEARQERRHVRLWMFSSGREEQKVRPGAVFPLRFYISTRNGRAYLLAHEAGTGGLTMFRLDRIRRVTPVNDHLMKKRKSGSAPSDASDPEKKFEALAQDLQKHVWGVSIGDGTGSRLDHVEMMIRAGENESFIRDRLSREKRCGRVTRVDEERLLFTADVCDALEMLPWIRTFTGRILSLECTNPVVQKRFADDLEALRRMYCDSGSERRNPVWQDQDEAGHA